MKKITFCLRKGNEKYTQKLASMVRMPKIGESISRKVPR